MSNLFLGIMTGTSLDAIDIALCRFENNSVELIGSHTSAWNPELREILMSLATSERVSLDLLTRTHFELARSYSEAVSACLQKLNLSPADIRAIGLHGQTIRHLPTPVAIAQSLAPISATFQLGSGSALAALCRIDVVSDFRSGDVALGGQGAPLVPMFDARFLRSDRRTRLVTNIGGISNVTYLPIAGSVENIVAFDTGPGNMIMDGIARHSLGKPFDDAGTIAATGTVNEELLHKLLAHPYFAIAPPKSTGREIFGSEFLNIFLENIETGTLSVQDALATATEVTARSIVLAFQWLPKKVLSLSTNNTKASDSDAISSIDEIIVSGGGAFNIFLIERLRTLARCEVLLSDSFGIPAQWKEAIAFAFFAKALIAREPIHIPSTTGASRTILLGSLSIGSTSSR
jgi:anhydro-N-acetylmuramic acid kinase